MLDAGPLGKLARRKPPEEIRNWFKTILEAGVAVVVPEIADFEVRRELLRAGLHQSLSELDELKSVLRYVPITTSIMLKAAEFWADARRHGRPTVDPKELDGDVILATQA